MSEAPAMSVPLLLDGAMGTLLGERGFELRSPLFSARALLDAPEQLVEIHVQYLQAGAQILTTNSFNLHAQTLVAAGLGERQAELVTRSVELFTPVRQFALTHPPCIAAGLSRFRIAGSIPPRPGVAGAPGQHESPELARAEYGRYAALLADAGVDLILLETFTDATQLRLALEGVSAGVPAQLPIWVSVVAGARAPDSSRPDGSRLAGGEPFAAIAPLLRAGQEHRVPDAVLLNCTQLDAIPAALDGLAEQVPREIPLGLSPHLGKRRYDGTWIERIVEGEVFAAQIHAWLQARPRYVLAGACCGSRPAEIAALRRHLHGDDATREQAYAQLAALLP